MDTDMTLRAIQQQREEEVLRVMNRRVASVAGPTCCSTELRAPVPAVSVRTHLALVLAAVLWPASLHRHA